MAALVSDRAMAQQPLHPFFAGQHREVRIVVPKAQDISQTKTNEDKANSSAASAALDPDEDPNHGRRKRRRTLSPTSDDGVNAQEATTERDAVSQLEGGENERSRHAASIQTEIPQLLIEDDTQVAGDLPPQLDGTSEGQGEEPSGTPKKLLKLRPDGKLKSPGSTEQEGETRGRRRGRGPGKKMKHLVIKYGRTPHERIAVGRKLESVISGKLRVYPEPESTIVDVLESDTKPSLRSKSRSNKANNKSSTHPFFLGAPKRDRSGAATAREKTENTAVKSQQAHASVPRSKPAAWPTSFGASFTKMVKTPGSVPPVWPPSGMVHVRGLQDLPAHPDTILVQQRARVEKRKGKEGYIAVGEEIYSSQKHLVQSLKENASRASDLPSQRKIRAPTRLLLTNAELLARVDERLRNSDTNLRASRDLADVAKVPAHHFSSTAAQRLCSRIATSASVFDTFEADTQDWCHKFAPKTTQDLLHDQGDVQLLKRWIRAMNVDHVDTGSKVSGGKPAIRKQLAAKRRKRKAKEELDDFIVSSDDELANTDEFTEADDVGTDNDAASNDHRSCTLKKLKQSSFAKTRAVLLSGPTGCGKTAAVYAIATELDFEVFEVNAGTRRSGRDIVDRVGDMTRNHLVRQGAKDVHAEAAESDAPITLDAVTDDQQTSVASFFKPTSSLKPLAEKRGGKSKAEVPKQKPRKQQKQSLILLEEVDLLFEEDRPFWSAVFALVVQSKRPIIMTCSDEQSLPLEDFVDTAILRLSPPSSSMVAEYLLCLAANEGHLLEYSAVHNLTALRHGDLRGSINDLQFWCQMAVGDNGYGISWFLHAQSANKKRDKGDPKLRIVSEGTLEPHCFLFDRKQDRPRDLEYQSQLLEEVYTYNQFDPVETDADLMNARSPLNISDSSKLDRLRMTENCYDALSAADTFAFAPGTCDLLDVSQPALSESMRAHYPDSFPLLDTNFREDCTSLGQSIAFFIRASAQCQLHGNKLSKRKSMVEAVLKHPPSTVSLQSRTTYHARNSFAALIETDEGTPFNPSRGPGVSTLHGPIRQVAAEVAPIIRSIALFDMELAKERTRLSNALSEPGRTQKRQRRTRAARAALEGGSKASTRRERWWNRGVDYNGILKTGSLELNRIAVENIQTARVHSHEEDDHHGLTTEESNPATPGDSAGDSADELML